MRIKGHKKESIEHASVSDIVYGSVESSLSQRVSAKTGISTRTLKIVPLALIVVIALAVTGVFLQRYINQSKTVISMGNYQIDQKTYDRLLKEAAAINQSRAEARSSIMNGLAARAAADKLKIEYQMDDASISQAASNKFTAGVPTEYQKIAAYPDLINSVVQLRADGGYKYALLDFPFSRYIVGFTRTDFGDEKLIGNKEAITKDKEYAKQQMDLQLAALKNKTKTPEQVASELQKDPRLVNGQYGNQSGVITVTLEGNRLELLNIGNDLLEQIKLASSQINTPRITEQLVGVSPTGYGLADMSDIDRSGQTFIGWRVLIVSNSYASDPSIKTKYETDRKEFLKNAEVR